MITYGDKTYGTITPIGNENDIHVGKYCSIAEGVTADCGIGHKINVISTWPFDVFWHGCPNGVNSKNTGTTKGDINIGSDVWIGKDVILMSGITIGDGAVVGIGAVVTKDVPPYSVVAGVPAIIRKYRFNSTIIQKLLKIKWWDWEEDRIRKASRYLVDENLDNFFNFVGELN